MNTRNIILTIGLALAVPAFGQGLHKEINVEQEIVPVKRDAARITVLPSLQLPAISRPQLAFSNRVVTTRVPNTITTLEPVAYGDSLFTSPYRGYVALGIGAPLFNAAFSAGYRILDTDRTRLSIWSQYDGDVYTHKVTDIVGGDKGEVKNYWRDHSASVGLDLHQALGSESALNAGVDYNYGYHTVPVGYLAYSQNVSRANLTATFLTRSGALDWSAGLHYRHFGFYHLDAPAGYSYLYKDYDCKPVRQNLFGAALTSRLPFGENASLGLDVDADFLSSSRHFTPVYPYGSGATVANGSSTSGLIALRPHFDYQTSTVKARFGVQADISINDGRVFHIAPEATVAWTPSQIVGFEVKAKGGSELNALTDLYDITPYIGSFMAYSQSHIPFAIDGRVTVGPFFGAHIEFFGGYAKANDWLMPVAGFAYPGGALFDRVDLSAWHVGAAIGYDYRKVLSARVSYETAPHDYEDSFYEWRDRAKHVIGVSLKVRPVKPLQVDLGWEFRAGRRSYFMMVDQEPVSPDLQTYTPVSESLGCVSNLSLGASYAVSDALTGFVRGENLLNRRYYHLGDRYSQGINFIIGASLKF